MTTPNPSGCRHCGLDERGHMQHWTTEAGWHPWTQPTQQQIKARMRARRNKEPHMTDNQPIPCGESGCLCYGVGEEHADHACGCDCPREEDDQ